ncbi:MAG: nucleotide pyrophosphohydrolase [Planctomycetota bacterium]|jgi:NTP pyrophosphatase (non-canonical NTP hydrolase)
MNDATTTISDLMRAVEQFRDARNWGRFHSPKALASAISIEAAELQEVFLWRADDDDFSLISASNELADIVIYCLSFASACNIDIARAVQSKMEHNAIKYPVSDKGLEGWERNHK